MVALHPACVLLVEDDDDTAELELRCLNRAGIDVAVARTAGSAVQQLTERPFAAVLLDYHLPDGDCWRVVDAAKLQVPAAPVVLLTGDGTEHLVVKALQRGVTDFVRKSESYLNELPAVVDRAGRLGRAAAELHRSSELFNIIAEAASEVITVTNASGAITYVSPAIRTVLGYEPEELIGTSGPALVHPQDRARMVTAQWPASQTGQILTSYRCRKKTGDYAWLEVSAKVIRNAQTGAVIEIVGLARDVTERHRLIEQLQLVTDATSAGIILVDPSGQTVLVNARVERLFGYPRGELLGTPFEAMQRMLFRARGNETERVQRSFTDTRPLHQGRDLVGLHKNGDEIPVEATLKKIRTADGDFTLTTIVDISERVQAAEELKQSLLLKDTLLREIHHRVKNDLQVVAGLVELQASRIGEPQQRALFDETRSRVQAIALLHDCLCRRHELDRIAASEYLDNLIQHWVRAHVHDERVVDMRVDADDTRFDLDCALPIGLIVNELVTNAFRHAFTAAQAEPAQISIRVRTESKQTTIVVADNGVGLPAGAVPHRARSLGMQLIVSLAEQLRGKVTFESPAGTRATVTFPGPSGSSTS